MLVKDDQLDRQLRFVYCAQWLNSAVPESLELGITESQRERTDARLANLPDAFRPEHLATLERQCRDFFRSI